MRGIFVAVLVAGAMGLIGVATSSAAPVNGAALANAVQPSEQVVQVRDGCGRGFRRNRYGRCVRIR